MHKCISSISVVRHGGHVAKDLSLTNMLYVMEGRKNLFN